MNAIVPCKLDIKKFRQTQVEIEKRNDAKEVSQKMFKVV